MEITIMFIEHTKYYVKDENLMQVNSNGAYSQKIAV